MRRDQLDDVPLNQAAKLAFKLAPPTRAIMRAWRAYLGGPNDPNDRGRSGRGAAIIKEANGTSARWGGNAISGKATTALDIDIFKVMGDGTAVEIAANAWAALCAAAFLPGQNVAFRADSEAATGVLWQMEGRGEHRDRAVLAR